MQYIQCPDVYESLGDDKTIFLAGGISNCRNWQDDMVSLLKDTELVVVNPRRKVFDMSDPNMTREQIAWEFVHLRRCQAKLFWFSPETLCPIALFELGKYCRDGLAPLFVGADPEYKRLLDLQVQLELERPLDCEVSLNLEDLAQRVVYWSENS